MKQAKLLHNPGAGDQDHDRNALIDMIEAAGFNCSYESTKKLKKKDDSLVTDIYDIIILAGGDGTIKKIAPRLLHENIPIGLLPKGTANNIAQTLGIPFSSTEVVESWKQGKIRQFDIGHIYGLDESHIFLEGFGYGIFPLLMERMKKEGKEDIEDPIKKLQAATELLYKIASDFEAVSCSIKIDGHDYTDKFLLVEVMNIRSIGPNLKLAPMADPGDGYFDVILIPESKRSELLRYLHAKHNGVETETVFHSLQAKSLKIKWEGDLLHIDDQKISIKKPKEHLINIQPAALNFIVP